MKKTTKTRRPVSKVKRTVADSLAALMAATTAAGIGASAAPGRCELLNLCNFTRTADDIVKGEMKNKSYSEVLKKWQTALKDPTKAFPNGCDIDGDGETTEEEKNEVADKLKEYAAGMTVGLMKMGLNACCDGLFFFVGAATAPSALFVLFGYSDFFDKSAPLRPLSFLLTYHYLCTIIREMTVEAEKWQKRKT